MPPVHIRIKPTNVCNHNCHYCAYRAENLQLGKDMDKTDFIPREKMFEIIQDIEEMGVQAVTFSGGGEPFCYPYLLESARKLNDAAIQFACLTNGSKLTGETAEFFAHHATWLRVSMDGWDGYSYASYRGTSEKEYSKVTSNMLSFKKYGGRCYLGVSLIIDRQNCTHLFDMVSSLKDLGVESVKLSPCITDNSGRKNNVYHSKIITDTKKTIAIIKTKLQSKYFKIHDAYHELDEKFDKDYSWCPYQQILPVIGADQNLYPCQDKAYNLKEGLLGSIKEERFKNLWVNNKNMFFKINPSQHCKHHCIANNKNLLIQDYLQAEHNHLAFV